MWLADAMAVRVAAMSCRKSLSTKEFACDVFGAAFVDWMQFMLRYSLSLAVSSSRAPSVWSLRAFLSHRVCILDRDLMMALVASLFCCIICMSVHLVQASTIIWMYLLPSGSAGDIGSVVSEDIASSNAYLF
eukprot:Plantae.Rhodophyta-Palmaria_palmata.ctg10392.p2 GENE.Plantae.Rhodophyta-Palmaria_palmata.ctg10392~~Plantae.Rhodophyta-Palmaria_palmata.ctg10392.p2  ORF type:complete len:132 (-),score=9.46 Plantae.Rhodophyta-Palmaria_palmata.ctg10392:402-797(-)